VRGRASRDSLSMFSFMFAPPFCAKWVIEIAGE
jgi:hypothetical protein